METTVSFSLTFRVHAKVIPTPYGHVLELEEYPAGGELGGPALPAKVLQVALPANARADKVVFTAQRTVMVGDGPIFVAPLQPLQPAKIDVLDEAAYFEKYGEKRPFKQPVEPVRRPVAPTKTLVTPVAALYWRAAEKPKPWAVLLDTFQMGTVDIVNLEINPLRYTSDGQLNCH